MKPAKVMYDASSYHDGACGGDDVQDSDEPVFLDPVKIIEQKQLELIKKLQNLGDTINAVLAESGKKAPVNSVKGKPAKGQQSASNTEKKETKETSAQPAAANKKDSKKEKEAKKEARKENKAKALGAGTAVKSAKGVSCKPWVIKEEKREAESGQSIAACLPPRLTSFTTQPAGALQLSVTQEDLSWVQLLSQVGSKRGVSFVGKVLNKAESAKTTVTVSLSNEVSVKSDNGSSILKGRIAVWKVLGSVLGLFSFGATHAIHATHTHLWLRQIDDVLLNSQFKDTLMRSASQFLSGNDTLGVQFGVSLADVVAFSLLSSVPNKPNNVESWANRVQQTLA